MGKTRARGCNFSFPLVRRPSPLAGRIQETLCAFSERASRAAPRLAPDPLRILTGGFLVFQFRGRAPVSNVMIIRRGCSEGLVKGGCGGFIEWSVAPSSSQHEMLRLRRKFMLVVLACCGALLRFVAQAPGAGGGRGRRRARRRSQRWGQGSSLAWPKQPVVGDPLWMAPAHDHSTAC